MKFIMPKEYKNHNPKIMEYVKNDIEKEKEFHYLFIGASSVGKTHFANYIAGKYLVNPVMVNAMKLYEKLSKAYQLYGSEKQQSMTDINHWQHANNLIITDLGKETYLNKNANKLIGSFLLSRSGFIRRDKTFYDGKYYGIPHTIVTTDIGFRPDDNSKPTKHLKDAYGYDIVESLCKSFTFMVFNNVKSINKSTVRIINDNV